MKNFIMLIGLFFKGHEKRYAYGGAAVIMTLALSSVYLTYLFNDWRKNFWDAVQNLDAHQFIIQVGIFTVLAFSFVFVTAFLKYVSQVYCLRWRKYMTMHYINKWLALDDKNSVENPDQRLQQDLEKFVNLTQSLATDLINCLALLIVFIPLLWSLSQGVHINGYTIPGYFFWIAIIWALLGSTISYFIGKKLPQLEYNNQRTEADFRYDLVRVREGQKISKIHLMLAFDALYRNHSKLFSWYKYFNLWGTSYSQTSIILPVLAAFPLLLARTLSLGQLMQIMHAFSQVSDSLSYIINRYLEFCDLVATTRRLSEFVNSLEK